MTFDVKDPHGRGQLFKMAQVFPGGKMRVGLIATHTKQGTKANNCSISTRLALATQAILTGQRESQALACWHCGMELTVATPGLVRGSEVEIGLGYLY